MVRSNSLLSSILCCGRNGWRNVRLSAVASSLSVVQGGAGNLASKLFESLALGLRNKKSSEATAEHEEGEDLHDVVEPWGRVSRSNMALGSKRSKDGLCDDSTNFAGGSGEAVRGGSVTCWETLSRHNEGGGVGSEVEKELGQNVQSQKTMFTQVVESEADDDEDDGKENEAHELYGFAADGVDGGNRDPVTWDGSSADDDQVADSGIAEDFIHIITLGIANGCENDRVVESETVEGDICPIISSESLIKQELRVGTYRGRTTNQRSQEGSFHVSTGRSDGRSRSSWPWEGPTVLENLAKRQHD